MPMPKSPAKEESPKGSSVRPAFGNVNSSGAYSNDWRKVPSNGNGSGSNDWRKVPSNGNCSNDSAWIAKELKAHFLQSSGKLESEFALVNGKLDAILDLTFNQLGKHRPRSPQVQNEANSYHVPPDNTPKSTAREPRSPRAFPGQEGAPRSARDNAAWDHHSSDATSNGGMDVGPDDESTLARPMQRPYVRSAATGILRRIDDRGVSPMDSIVQTPRSAWQSRRGRVKKDHNEEELFEFVQSCSEAIYEEDEADERIESLNSRSNEESLGRSQHLGVKQPDKDRRKDVRISMVMTSESLEARLAEGLGVSGADSPRGGLSSPHLGSAHTYSTNRLGSERTSCVTTETKLTAVSGMPSIVTKSKRVLRRGQLRPGQQTKMNIMANLFGHEKKIKKSLLDGTPRINGLSEVVSDETENERVLPSCCCISELSDFLDDAESSKAASIYARVVSGVIILSCFVNFVQTVKPPPLNPDVVIPIEILLDAFFLVEVILRFYVAPQKFAFFLGINNIIDCVGSGPPLLIRLVTKYFLTQSDTTDDLRYYVLCLAPVLRLLKMLRRWQKFHLLIYSGVGLVMEVLPVLLVMLFLMAITFSSAIYFVEPRDNIEALPRALWMTIVTMTTVGYGDVTPVSTAGTITTSILAISSALYMAVPLGIVGNAFSKVWESRDWLYLVQHVQERLKRNGYGAADIPELFKLFGGGEGAISMHEFHRMITEMKLGIRDEKIMDLFFAFDSDGSGFIDAPEFIRVIFPSQYTKLYGKAMSRHPSNDASRVSSVSGSQDQAIANRFPSRVTSDPMQSPSGYLTASVPSGYAHQSTMSSLASPKGGYLHQSTMSSLASPKGATWRDQTSDND